MSNGATVRTYAPDLFHQPPEVAKATSVLDDMARRNKAWLDKVRFRLATLYLTRVTVCGRADAYVTADDARHFIRTEPERFGLPAGASPNIMGVLFHGGEWQPVDVDNEGRAIPMHTSATKGSRGNRIVRWRWVGPERSDR